jgi:hypothetical protein
MINWNKVEIITMENMKNLRLDGVTNLIWTYKILNM